MGKPGRVRPATGIGFFSSRRPDTGEASVNPGAARRGVGR